MQHPGEDLTVSLDDLQRLVRNAYSYGSNKTRHQLVVRGCLKRVRYSQNRLDLRKNLKGQLTIKKLREIEFHIESLK